MSYSLYLDAGTYNVSFLAAQRATIRPRASRSRSCSTARQVGWIMPSGTTYTLYNTSNFTVAAGIHTITFQGMSPATGESTALIDQVNLATVENSFSNGSFEAPVLASKAYAVEPSGSGLGIHGRHRIEHE